MDSDLTFTELYCLHLKVKHNQFYNSENIFFLTKTDSQDSSFLKHHKVPHFLCTFWVLIAKGIPLRIFFNVKGSTIDPNKFNSFRQQFFIFSQICCLDNVEKIFLGDGGAKIFLTEFFQRSNFVFVSLKIKKKKMDVTA